MQVQRIDHLVLTVASIATTCRFYGSVLGLAVVTGSGGRTALRIGDQKINLHQVDAGIEPRATRPTPGAGDFCLIAAGPIEAVVADLTAAGVTIEAGPVDRTGALGPMRSVYVRDPDGNLVELSVYPS